MANISKVKRIAVGILALMVLLAVMWGAWEAWYRLSGTAARDRLSAHIFLACTLTTDNADCDEDSLMATYPDAVQFCEQIHGNTKPMNYTAYARCLENEGVVFE